MKKMALFVAGVLLCSGCILQISDITGLWRATGETTGNVTGEPEPVDWEFEFQENGNVFWGASGLVFEGAYTVANGRIVIDDDFVGENLEGQLSTFGRLELELTLIGGALVGDFVFTPSPEYSSNDEFFTGSLELERVEE